MKNSIFREGLSLILPLKSLYSRIIAIGRDPKDNEEVKLQKTLLVAFSGIMGLLAIIWGAIYFYYMEYIGALITWSYSVISIFSLWIFSRIRSYGLFRVSQLSLSLILPFILMISLGGIKSSSAVVLWSLTSPLGALVFKGRKEAFYWFISYLFLLVAALILEDSYGFTNNLPEYVINVFFLMNLGGTSIIAFILVRYFVGEKNLALTLLESRHKWIKDAFSAYISPNLVAHLLKNPDELELGGQRRECSFIFTDLAGFTPFIEQSDPATLVDCINEYFGGMTEIVFRHEGTVSKIVGDALAVMFSAPIIQSDHAERAVACALEMDAFAQKFEQEKQKQGLNIGRTRIGVNTGTVIIGNMGSKNQLDYRALGDAVNTTARLESANKQLGTRICVSGATVAQCPDFMGRPIGALLLKGKMKAVETYEPLSQQESYTEWVTEYLEAFDVMKDNSKKAISAFKSLTKKYPEDKLIRFHYERLNSGKTGTTLVLTAVK